MVGRPMLRSEEGFSERQLKVVVTRAKHWLSALVHSHAFRISYHTVY